MFLTLQCIQFLFVGKHPHGDKLNYNYRTVNDDPEVKCSQTHQVGIDAENKHHGKGEKQRQRYHGGYYQRRAQIAKQQQYDQKNDDTAKNQVFKNGRGGFAD